MAESTDKLIGRRNELASLVARIESDAHILTVVGPPGVGKSRLAREALVAADITASIVCDLEGVQDVEGFLQALGRRLHVEGDGDTKQAVVAALRRRDAVVLLDGFDHLVPLASATVGDLSDEVPGVLWLVTTRERLGLPAEELHPVGPLPVAAAVELLTSRTDTIYDLRPLEQLVERLDYNPLAVALAAARLRTFSPQDLLGRLDRRFALLRAEAEAARPSLAEAIGLSWELLDKNERECLAQCTVFAASFDLDAAEGVIVLDAEAPWVLDVVESLVDKSLLVREGAGRLRMYESIRAFVRGQDSDGLADANQRYADHYLRRGATWSGTNWSADRLQTASLDAPHLISILSRFAEAQPKTAGQAAVVLNALLRHRGTAALHFDVLGRGILAARGAGDDAVLAQLLQARGELGVVTGRLPEAEVDCLSAAGLAAATDQPSVRIRAETQHAEVERRTGRASSGLARLDALLDADIAWTTMTRRYADAHRAACLVELGRLDDARQVVMHTAPAPVDANAGDEYQALKRLAYAHYYLGNYEEQQRLNEAAWALAERVGDRRRTARARQGLGDAAFARGDFDAARAAYLIALSDHRELGNEHLCGVLLGNLGAAEHRIDQLDSAAAHYVEALTMHRRSGATPYEAVVEFALGALEHERGSFDDAGFHYQRAVELFTKLGQQEDVVATQVCVAWLELQRTDPQAALAQLDAIEADDVAWRAVVERTRVFVTKAGDWERDAPGGPSLPARLARALGANLSGKPVDLDTLANAIQGRLLLSLLGERDAQRTDTVARRAALVVAPGGEWFQTTGEPVNLRRRKAHRRILDELMTRRAGDPGHALDVYDAFDLGWPGEHVEPEAAAERVYWVVGVLRRLGLDGLLLTSDEGYYLDPSADVRRAQNV